MGRAFRLFRLLRLKKDNPITISAIPIIPKSFDLGITYRSDSDVGEIGETNDSGCLIFRLNSSNSTLIIASTLCR